MPGTTNEKRKQPTKTIKRKTTMNCHRSRKSTTVAPERRTTRRGERYEEKGYTALILLASMARASFCLRSAEHRTTRTMMTFTRLRICLEKRICLDGEPPIKCMGPRVRGRQRDTPLDPAETTRKETESSYESCQKPVSGCQIRGRFFQKVRRH